MVKLSGEIKKRIEEKWGVIVVPKGETRRAKAIRKNAVAYEKQQVDELEKGLDLWIKLNPTASVEEVDARYRQHGYALQCIGNAHDFARVDLPNFDWREHDIDVGPVLNQGDGCNTCWAFAATSAAACSLQKNYNDSTSRVYYTLDKETGELLPLVGGISFSLGDPSPFVQDLLNCMPIKEEELCRSGWHGKAFDFMVYKKGIPMSCADGYADTDPFTGETTIHRRKYVRGKKFECSPNRGFNQANAWDYVNFPPDELPTVEQLKASLIAHGPLVVPIAYDKRLLKYKSGVFKGENMGMINHVMLLVGWDDEKEAWLIKNSWGEEWGEKGFGWIKYGSNNIGVFAAWIEAQRTF